jgi:hypothetical protein
MFLSWLMGFKTKNKMKRDYGFICHVFMRIAIINVSYGCLLIKYVIDSLVSDWVYSARLSFLCIYFKAPQDINFFRFPLPNGKNKQDAHEKGLRCSPREE